MTEPETPSGKNDRLLKYGLIGTVLVALCCFTPILVILLGVVGLSAMLGWIDLVLLPALAVFIGITLYALWRRGRIN
jgi:mercuric ion transport protein